MKYGLQTPPKDKNQVSGIFEARHLEPVERDYQNGMELRLAESKRGSHHRRSTRIEEWILAIF